MQETGTLTVSAQADRERYPDSICAALGLSDVRIERPDGTIAAPGELGEIVGRSPATCTSYFDGLPDEIRGERVAALIVKPPNVGDELTAEGIETACREHPAGFETPRTIVIESEPLPRTPTGKVQKFLLVERFKSAG